MKFVIRNSLYEFVIRNSLYEIRYTKFAIRNSLYEIRYTKFVIRNSLYDIRYMKFVIRNSLYDEIRYMKSVGHRGFRGNRCTCQMTFYWHVYRDDVRHCEGPSRVHVPCRGEPHSFPFLLKRENTVQSMRYRGHCRSSLWPLLTSEWVAEGISNWNVKVKQSRNRPSVAQSVPGVLGSQISWHSERESGEVVSLTHRPPLPPRVFLVFIFTRGWVDPRAMERSEGNMSLKNPVIPPGIYTGTARLVAQLRYPMSPVFICTTVLNIPYCILRVTCLRYFVWFWQSEGIASWRALKLLCLCSRCTVFSIR